MRKDSVEPRVEHIADLMAKGLYVTRTTARQLAAEWGVSKTTVQHYAAEASRIVRGERGTIEDIRDRTIARLETIALKSMSKGEFRPAVEALKAIAKITGCEAPKRLEHTGPNGTPLGLPPELAMLEPKPTAAELMHYVKIDEFDCTAQGCRVHPARALELAEVEAPAELDLEENV